MSLLLHHLLFSSTSIHSQTVAKKPAITFAGYAILLNLTQFLDHVEKSMNNLYPNSGRDRSCSPESPVPFLPPPSNQRKGSGLRVYYYSCKSCISSQMRSDRRDAAHRGVARGAHGAQAPAPFLSEIVHKVYLIV